MIDKSEIESWATRLPPSKLRTTILELLAELDRATRALVHGGFEDRGGEEWAPPIGPKPRFVATSAELESARNAALEGAARVVEARFIGFRVDDADLTEMAAEIRSLATTSTEPAKEVATKELELDRIALYWKEQDRRGCADAFECALREAWCVASRCGSSPADAGGLTPEQRKAINSAIDCVDSYGRGDISDVLRSVLAATSASASPAAPTEPKMTIRDGIWWPEGYCTDPDGRIVAPAGKDVDFKFGYDIGYAEGIAVRRAPAAPGLAEAAQKARSQLKLWMRDHGQDIATQEAIRAIDAALAAAAPAVPVPAPQQWISVEDRLPPVGELVLVYSPPTQYDHPGDVNIRFDCIDPDADEPTSWLNHNEHYEHFCCVAKPEGSVGPSAEAPYTHWMPLPAAPSLQQGKEGTGDE